MKLLIALVSVGVFTTVGLGADKPLAWPRFRGPDGSGVADDQKPPVEFGPDKNVKWKAPAPSGLSSPIVAGDKLVITAFEDGKLSTVAYGRADGKQAWKAEAPAKKIEAYHKTEGSPAASTSATDGKRIVSYFGSCGLFCYDLSGKELWRFEIPRRLPRETSVAALRPSSWTAPSFSSVTKRWIQKSSPSTRSLVRASGSKNGYPRPRTAPPSFGTRRQARKLWRRATHE